MSPQQKEARAIVATMGVGLLYGSFWSITHHHPVLFIALFVFGAICIAAAFEDIQ